MIQNVKSMIWDLFENSIEIFEQTNAGKWYEKKYQKTDTILPQKVYGIKVENGGYIEFDFVSPKNEESILKSFLNQYISKYQSKLPMIEDGKILDLSPKEKKQKILEKIKNSDRVENWVFYTTLYGIGTFCFFMSPQTLKQVHIKMASFLNQNNIEFKNEFSDAGWVYRFLINKPIDVHNQLLSNFKH